MNDYKNGMISGIVQTLSGYPFDTLKVLKQNNIKINNFKVSKLYNGLTFPLVSNSMIIGSQFYFYHNHSSLLAGIISGMMVAPVDYFKIQKQIKKDYKYKIQIPLGLNITILREVISLPIYFNSYYFLNEKLDNSFISGGIAGMLSWLIPYPIDTIKTRMQTGYSFKKSISMGNYMRGIKFCLLRGFIVNSIGFYSVNKLNS